MESVGIGLIGCGDIAHLHTAALRDIAAAGLPLRAVAAADPVPANREAVARNFRFARFYDRAADLIADDEVDAVFVCTPTAFHRDLYLAVLDAGKHLYAEKPIAPAFPAVREVCAAAAAAPVVSQVGFQSRFNALLARARAIVQSGELGAPTAYLWRDDEAFPTTAVTGSQSNWRSQVALAGGGPLLEHSIHGLDILAWTFGAPSRVAAFTRRTLGFDVEDAATLTVEHESGTVGTLVTIYGGVTGREESRFEVFCERGVIEVTWGVVVDSAEASMRVQRAGEPPQVLDPRTVLAEHLAGLGVARTPYFWNELASRAFVEAILAGRAASPGFADALRAHAAVEAGYRSAAERRFVDLGEVLA